MPCLGCEKKRDGYTPMTYYEKPAVTRDLIVAAARSLIGVPFLHQGRNRHTGLDCVGFCIEVLRECGIEKIYDLEGYKRTPSASTLKAYLDMNFKEKPLETLQNADIVLMRLGGAKPRHVAIISDTQTDYKAGKEPMMVHALSSLSISRVIEQPIAQYRQGIVAAFQLPRIID